MDIWWVFLGMFQLWLHGTCPDTPCDTCHHSPEGQGFWVPGDFTMGVELAKPSEGMNFVGLWGRPYCWQLALCCFALLSDILMYCCFLSCCTMLHWHICCKILCNWFDLSLLRHILQNNKTAGKIQLMTTQSGDTDRVSTSLALSAARAINWQDG